MYLCIIDDIYYAKKMNTEVYVTETSSFFPNNPVSNDDMENFIGMVDGKPSRVRPIILRQNGIKSRYYALDENQRITHTNAQLAKSAIDKLFRTEDKKKEIKFLSCGTSMPDQFMPSHASMVHGAAFDHSLEIASLSGVCMSGLMALKTAWMSIVSGNSDNAVCVASELISPTMLSRFFSEEIENLKMIEENPHIAFEKDFLRFMLSDGAAALLLQNKPTGKKNLRIDWIKTYSYANCQPACMYMWAEKRQDGDLKGWKNFTGKEMAEKSVWSLKQDVRQLNENAMKYFVDAVESSLIETGQSCDEITYAIPHLSSMYFFDKLDQEFRHRGIKLPMEKWFTNLAWVGNIGAASPFTALDELIRTKEIKRGDKILLMVPESGRFSCGTALFTVV